MKSLFPVDEKLADAISKELMEFVCHNQVPYSKKLQSFVATGCHDLRAGLLAIKIMKMCQEYLEQNIPPPL